MIDFVFQSRLSLIFQVANMERQILYKEPTSKTVRLVRGMENT